SKPAHATFRPPLGKREWRMTTKAELERLREERKKLDEQQRELDKQERALQEKMVGEAFDGLIASLKELLPGMSPAQRGRIRALLGRFGKPAKSQASGAASQVAPKYRLPNGATWTGRGSPPKTFREWEATKQGQAWRKKHPDPEAWPLI